METADTNPPHWKRKEARQLLHFAAERGDLAALKQALADGADINDHLDMGDPDLPSLLTPLQMALYEGHHGVAEWMIENGADANRACGPLAYTTLFTAVVGKAPLALLEKLAMAGAAIDAQGGHRGTALFAAVSGYCEDYGLDAIRFLVARGADIQVRIPWRDTHLPLFEFAMSFDSYLPHEAKERAKERRLIFMKEFIEQGCDLNAMASGNEKNMSILEVADDMWCREFMENEQAAAGDSVVEFHSAPDKDRAGRYVTDGGKPTPETWRMLAFGYLPLLLEAQHWQEKPQEALKLWNAAGPYYRQKYAGIDLTWAITAKEDAVGTAWQGRVEKSAAGLPTPTRR